MDRCRFTVQEYADFIGRTRPVAAIWLKRLEIQGLVEKIREAHSVEGIPALYKFVGFCPEDGLEDGECVVE